MKLKSKKVKGMTLIEVIIALLIFTLLASLMVQVGSVTKSLMMNTNHLNNKRSVEAPVAAVQDVDELTEVAAILPEKKDEAGNVIEYDKGDPVRLTISMTGYTSHVDTLKYSTEGIADASDKNCDTSAHMNGHLEFYVIQDTPPAAPPAVPPAVPPAGP